MPKRPMSDVIVMVPGIMGSVLTHKGKDVWALSGGAILRALFSLAGSVKELTLGKDDPSLDDLDDGVAAPRVMPDTTLIPGFWKIDGYTGIRRFLFNRFELTEGLNYIELPYDWRRDNRAAARKLKRTADEILARRRTDLPGKDVKLILVTHSMGGLVSRYYLECLDGAKDTRLLVTFGTPFRGSIKALDYVCNGFKAAVIDLSELLRSFTSVYQLLPTYACLVSDNQPRMKLGQAAGLPHFIPERFQDAAKFHDQMNKAAEAKPPGGTYLQYNVVGVQQPTLLFAQPGEHALTTLAKDKNDDWFGDGTVPRISATPGDAPVNPRFYIPEQHGSLQNNITVQENLAGLLEEGLIDFGAFKGIGDEQQKQQNQRIPIQLSIPDAVPQGEALEITARPVSDTPVQLVARVELVGAPEKSLDAPLKEDGGVQRARVPLPPGCYRVTVSSPVTPGVQPVSDVCLVVGQTA